MFAQKHTFSSLHVLQKERLTPNSSSSSSKRLITAPDVSDIKLYYKINSQVFPQQEKTKTKKTKEALLRDSEEMRTYIANGTHHRLDKTRESQVCV